MRVASLNLNKRLGNPSTRASILRWLGEREIGLVLAQEPYSERAIPPSLGGFLPIGGDHHVYAWTVENMEPPLCDRVRVWWQRLELGYMAVHHVYLDPYSRRRRAQQLEELRGCLLVEPERPTLIVGDFNLAPRPEDGRFDGNASRFNSETDRAPFRQLLVDVRLEDLTSGGTSKVEYTVVKKHRGRAIEFRCDLALASDHMAPTIVARYDHTTRAGDMAFTDHSAVVLDLPVTPHSTDAGEQRLWPAMGKADTGSGPISQPHKTAMARRRPSPFARKIVGSFQQDGVRSVLDYGCGRGADVDFYRRIGLVADGYDPHTSFGWHAQPQGTYDLVTIIFVLNVLPDPWQRFKVLRSASRHLADKGLMLVVCRSPSAVERIARSRRWPRHNDGYWSSQTKGTFQRGISARELRLMARWIGLVPVREGGERRDTTQLLFSVPAGGSGP